MKKKAIAILLCFSVFGSLLTACGSTAASSSGEAASTTSTTEADSATSGASSADTGSTMTFAISAECDELDPGINDYLASSSMIMNLFMGLYMTGEDGKTLTNGCAESYDLSDDGLTYTFHLYDDLKWSDGSPLTAEDFEWSWLRELNPETASPSCALLFVIKGAEEFNSGEGTADDVAIKAIDDTTLEITLNNPTSYFLDLISAEMPVQKAAVEGSDTWTLSPDTFVCNGAYMMTGYSPEESYTLTKNPNYKYADDVTVDTINVVFINDSSAALTAFENGEIDMTNNISVSAQEKYSGTDTLKDYSTIGTSYADINCEKISDARVRKALSEAIDRETLCQSFISSKPTAATGYVPVGISYSDSGDDYRATLGDLVTYDPDDAKKLLQEAVADGFDATRTFTYICKNDTEQKNIAQALQSMWKQNLGLDFEIVTYESGSYWDVVHQGDFDVDTDGWSGDYNDPSTMLDVLKQGEVETNCRWADDAALKYDSMQDEAAAETDQTKRFEIFAESEKLLIDDSPIIPVYYRKSQMLTGDRIAYTTNDQLGHYLIKYTKLK